MQMNSKQLFAIAAIGGAIWYFMRKQPAANAKTAATPSMAPAPATGGIWDGFGVGGSLSDAMGQLQATNPSLGTTSNGGTSQLAAQLPPAPAASGGAVWGGSSGGGGASPTAGYTISDTGLRTYADGSSHQMTPGELHVYNLQKSGKFVY